MIDSSEDWLINMAFPKKSRTDSLEENMNMPQQNQDHTYIEGIRPYYRRRDIELLNTVIRNRQFMR